MPYKNKEQQKAYQRAYHLANRECHLVACKRRREEDPKRIKAEKAAYYQRNRKVIREKHKAYREANSDRIKGQKRLYYQEHKAECNAASKRNYRRRTDEDPERMRRGGREAYARNKDVHKERVRAWRRNNPEAWSQINRMWVTKRNRLLESTPGDVERADWLQILRVYAYGCDICGEQLTGRTATMDHFIPISGGGTNWPDNLRPLCRSCNARKHDKMPTRSQCEAYIWFRIVNGLPCNRLYTEAEQVA